MSVKIVSQISSGMEKNAFVLLAITNQMGNASLVLKMLNMMESTVYAITDILEMAELNAKNVMKLVENVWVLNLINA